MTEDYTTLTDDELRARLVEAYEQADTLMREACAGGLDYGWDWPTFCAMFPHEATVISRLKAEGRKRGLK